jgi:hypothetical protein
MRILAVAAVFGLLVISHSVAAQEKSLKRALREPLLLRVPRRKRARHKPQSVGRLKSLQRLASAEWIGLAKASAVAADRDRSRPVP